MAATAAAEMKARVLLPGVISFPSRSIAQPSKRAKAGRKVGTDDAWEDKHEAEEAEAMAEEFGQSGALPVVLAAWAPTASGLMLALALLLHTEDG